MDEFLKDILKAISEKVNREDTLTLALDLCQGLPCILLYTQIVNKREGISWGGTDQSHHSIQICLKEKVNGIQGY